MSSGDPWRSQALGAFIRSQRQLADYSLRELAAMTDVSNAYLSQIERGLHQPSVRVLTAIAQALQVPFDELLTEAGMRGEAGPDGSHARAGEGPTESAAPSAHVCSTVEAIDADPRLTVDQRQALLAVYRSFVPAEEPGSVDG